MDLRQIPEMGWNCSSCALWTTDWKVDTEAPKATCRPAMAKLKNNRQTFLLCVWVWVCFLWLKWSTMYIPQVGLGLRDLIWCVYLHESSWYNISNQIFHAPCFVVWKKRFLTYRPPTTETPRVLSSGMLHQLACSAMSSKNCPTQWTVDKVPTLPNPML